MIDLYLGLAAALVVAGAVVGALAVVCLGIRREDHDLSLTTDISGRVIRGARRLNGVYTRIPAQAREVPLRRQNPGQAQPPP